MALNLEEIIQHGQDELDVVAVRLTRHQPADSMCACHQPLPCHARAGLEAYAAYWEARLDMLRPQLRARTLAAVR